MKRKQVEVISVYRAYMNAKFHPTKTATDVAREYGMSRADLYQIVKFVEKGEPYKLKMCTQNSNFQCMWEHKYKMRYAVLPRDRSKRTVEALASLIQDMHKDGFTISMIASCIKRDRSTVLHHIKALKNEKN